MYTEMSLKEALKYFMKGRKVLVLNEYDDKSISAERIEDCLPEEEKYILLSFANYTGLDIGWYEKDGENDNFYPGDEEETYASYGLIVNAWMELPKPYRQNDEGVEDDAH